MQAGLRSSQASSSPFTDTSTKADTRLQAPARSSSLSQKTQRLAYLSLNNALEGTAPYWAIQAPDSTSASLPLSPLSPPSTPRLPSLSSTKTSSTTLTVNQTRSFCWHASTGKTRPSFRTSRRPAGSPRHARWSCADAHWEIPKQKRSFGWRYPA